MNKCILTTGKSSIAMAILAAMLVLTAKVFSQADPAAAERMKTHVMTLADDAMQGRYTGSEGNFKAASYIQSYMEKIGVKPAVNGSYRQSFSFSKGLKLGSNNNVWFNVLVEKPGVPKEMWKSVRKNWKTGEDWTPVRFSDNGTVTGELIFAGFGITAKDQDYDDYKDIDVKGKIVIVLTDSAEGKSPDPRFSKYADLRYKATNAREHGAAGIIFVKTQSDSANNFYKMNIDRMFGNTGIVAIQANRTKLALLFPRSQQLYPLEQEIIKTKKPKWYLIPGITATITVDMSKEDQQVDNVAGIIKGTDPKLSEEYIVIGAHFDHLGMGGDNSLYRGKESMVHNGADDNASGVSGILELAERFARQPLRRSVLVVAFNGEEEGLLGSSAFVKSTPVPTEKMAAMFNFDMIGRMKNNSLSIFGTGSSSRFSTIVDSLAALDSIKVAKVKEGYGPSDHSSFYKEKVPVMFMFTGVHEDYHRPSDDWDKLNYHGMAEIIDYSETVIRTLGNADIRPDYIQVAEATTQDSVQGRSHGYGGVWFGIVPNFEENPDGFKVGGTQPGSPAQKSGLLEGDIITKFGGKTVKNLYDLTYALREFKPGDKVIVEAIRNGKPMKLEVTLAKR